MIIITLGDIDLEIGANLDGLYRWVTKK